jgi:hypothetical protein
MTAAVVGGFISPEKRQIRNPACLEASQNPLSLMA